MNSLPDVADLRLVEAVARHGSVGAAARELLVSQPAASQRIAALERRCGVALFDRDTQGARATAAGTEMAAQARHILGHLGDVFERARAAAQAPSLHVGTIPSLAPTVFLALAHALPDAAVAEVADHGPTLVGWVSEGSLDHAVVAVAGQMSLPRGTVALPLGTDPIVVLLPDGCPAPVSGARPFAGRTVRSFTTDLAGEDLDRRLVTLGAMPRRAATAETAVLFARELGQPAVLPRSLSRRYRRDEDREVRMTRLGGTSLSLVTRAPVGAGAQAVATALAKELGLRS